MLLQVLEDEFEVVVEDDSEVQVAATIVKIRAETSEGNFRTVDEMWERWKEKKDRPAPEVKVQSQSDDEESVDGEESDEDGDGDTEMADASVNETVPLKKERPAPDVDQEGFTKIVGKKRR